MHRSTEDAMQMLALPDGSPLPALGLGTWHFGESARGRGAELAALRQALEIGWRLIDTAEMYGEGGAEELVGEALAGALRAGDVRRDELFVVSKVYPHHASRSGVVAACERSLKRLRLDHLDLYLLHWRGEHALAQTVAGFDALQERGRVRHWGVSNFDRDDMDELLGVPRGAACASNQVYYALSERGIEFDLLPWLRARRMPCMAYCPLGRGQLAGDTLLQDIGRRHGASASQVALAWMLAQPGVLPIPKAAREVHLRENFAAQQLRLDADDLQQIERRFAPPRRKQPLAMV
jgi:diketogulonate reductase-like aldo/keto reductase